jgi:hypothetical protein
MGSERRTKLVLLGVVIVILFFSVVGQATPFNADTTTQADCPQSAAEDIRISQSSIQTTDSEITVGNPALLSGQLSAPKSNSCEVVVQMTMSVPSNMYVSGTHDIDSGGQGKITSTFHVSPGEVVSIRANVYASEPGERIIIADFRYYPVGYPDMEQQLSGITLQIDAVEANPHPGSGSRLTADILVLLGLLAVGVLLGISITYYAT